MYTVGEKVPEGGFDKAEEAIVQGAEMGVENRESRQDGV